MALNQTAEFGVGSRFFNSWIRSVHRQPVRPEVVTHIFGTFCYLFLGMAPRCIGALGRIRTPDPLIRSQVLYPTELPARGQAGFNDTDRPMQGQSYSAAASSTTTDFCSEITNLVPCSPVLSNSRLPPWPRTSSAAIASPRPVPPLRAPP